MNASARKRTKLLLIMMTACGLTACGTGGTIDVAAMRRTVGTDLIGVKGATVEDQNNINRTVVRLGAAKIYTSGDLATHGQRLAARQAN